jgi:hypothetical protein
MEFATLSETRHRSRVARESRLNRVFPFSSDVPSKSRPAVSCPGAIGIEVNRSEAGFDALTKAAQKFVWGFFILGRAAAAWS